MPLLLVIAVFPHVFLVWLAIYAGVSIDAVSVIYAGVSIDAVSSRNRIAICRARCFCASCIMLKRFYCFSLNFCLFIIRHFYCNSIFHQFRKRLAASYLIKISYIRIKIWGSVPNLTVVQPLNTSKAGVDNCFVLEATRREPHFAEGHTFERNKSRFKVVSALTSAGTSWRKCQI